LNQAILSFKRQQYESWTKERKIAQLSDEDEELKNLLDQRSEYLIQIQQVAIDHYSLSLSASDDSEFSDEEFDLSKINIKTEPTEHGIGIKQNIKIDDECHMEVNVKQPVIIKQEINDEKMDIEEAINEHIEVEYDKQIVNGTMDIEETENTEIETEKTDELENNQNDQTELKASDKDVGQQGKIHLEDESCSTSKSLVKRRRQSKKDHSDNEQTSKIESRKSIKIKQEPTLLQASIEIDLDADIVDGVKRELRPRKLNEGRIYFEPYDGTTTDDSDDYLAMLSD